MLNFPEVSALALQAQQTLRGFIPTADESWHAEGEQLALSLHQGWQGRGELAPWHPGSKTQLS